jgi:hypothetical protein
MVACQLRRIVALLCLAAILLLLAQPGHGLPVAVLVPFWIVLAVILSAEIRSREGCETKVATACLAVLSPRAPPVR